MTRSLRRPEASRHPFGCATCRSGDVARAATAMQFEMGGVTEQCSSVCSYSTRLCRAPFRAVAQITTDWQIANSTASIYDDRYILDRLRRVVGDDHDVLASTRLDRGVQILYRLTWRRNRKPPLRRLQDLIIGKRRSAVLLPLQVRITRDTSKSKERHGDSREESAHGCYLHPNCRRRAAGPAFSASK